MLQVWTLGVVAVLLANPQSASGLLCQNPNVTLVLDHVILSDECPDLENTTAINSTDTGLNTNLEINSNGTDQELPLSQDSPAWRITFKKVEFVSTGIYIPSVCLLAIFGNIVTLFVLRKDVLQSSSTIYLIGIAVADIIFEIIYFPVSFRAYPNVWTSRSFQNFNAFRYTYLSPFISINHTAAVWIIICFTVERFIAVTWPLKAQRYCTKHRARIAVIAAFVFSAALNGIRLFRRSMVTKVDSVTEERYYSSIYTELGRNKVASSFMFWSYMMFAEVIPFIALICLNSAIIWRVWLARQNRLQMSGNNETSDSSGKSRETQITRILIAVVFGFLVCNTLSGFGSVWVAINGLDRLYSSQEAYIFYIFALSTAMYITNPLVNCIVYSVCSSAMREGIKSQLCCHRKGKENPATKATSLTQKSKEKKDDA